MEKKSYGVGVNWSEEESFICIVMDRKIWQSEITECLRKLVKIYFKLDINKIQKQNCLSKCRTAELFFGFFFLF